MRRALFNILFSLLCISSVSAQEGVAPIDHNPLLTGRNSATAMYKSTALSLPIFDDFTGYSPYPDSTIWADDHVYVNNTMGISPVSRGVATFDALSRYGKPYDTIFNTNIVYADSLTLKPLDLSANQVSDNIFLSFYYQAQGRGFAPEMGDSLILFFRKNNGTWVKVWSREGHPAAHFKQVILPVDDTSYFYTDFQFRFVNKASINTNDDVWNIDYVRLDANRNPADTAINDVAFVTDPSFMLNDYAYMPYRHYLANVSGELGTQIVDSIRNGYTAVQNVNYGFTARESISNTPLASNGLTSIGVNPYTINSASEATYSNTVPIGGVYDKVIFENKFYIQSVSGTDKKLNDTVIREQIFDNYLAYDDGTAEKSYYLNMFPSLPGKIAIEHHLNQPDVLQGVDIYFGRQVPVGSNKIFSIAVYRKLQGVDGAPNDELLLQQDFMYPRYFEVNSYCTYKLDNPLSLPAGAFYIATIQPALSGSDSLYLGLDVNREQANHAYYNVDGTWNSSNVSGAIMIRPLVGQTVFNTYINDEKGLLIKEQGNVSVYPNPAKDKIVCQYAGDHNTKYYISDIQGRLLKQGGLGADKQIDISELLPGMYIIRLEIDGVAETPQKIIKQ